MEQAGLGESRIPKEALKIGQKECLASGLLRSHPINKRGLPALRSLGEGGRRTGICRWGSARGGPARSSFSEGGRISLVDLRATSNNAPAAKTGRDGF